MVTSPCILCQSIIYLNFEINLKISSSSILIHIVFSKNYGFPCDSHMPFEIKVLDLFSNFESLSHFHVYMCFEILNPSVFSKIGGLLCQ